VSFTGAASNRSGRLTVTDGVHTASIQRLGQYVASEFVVAGDRHGCTPITVTSVTQPGATSATGNAIAMPVTSWSARG